MLTNAYCVRETAVIASGQTLSDAIHIENFLHCGVVLGTITGTSLKFHVSDDDSTYVVLKDSSGDVALTVAANSAIAIPDAVMKFRFVKFLMAQQGQDTTILATLKY